MTKRELIVFEVTGETRQAKPCEPTLGELGAVNVFDDFSSRNEVILRRLSDAEVATLCAPAAPAQSDVVEEIAKYVGDIIGLKMVAREIRRRFGVKT